MNTSRADLNKLSKKPPYVFLSLILLVLSAIGVFLFFKVDRSRPLSIPTPSSTPTPSQVPTFAPLTIVPIQPQPSASLSATLPPITPTISTPSSIPTPTHQTFSSQEDGFSVDYSANRTLHQDQETSGNRYTFYSPVGSFTIHAGPTWSWSHPERQFSPTFKIDAHHTFRYDINLQTIVDIDRGNTKYTIQCVHNAKDELKSECEEFLSAFRFLNHD